LLEREVIACPTQQGHRSMAVQIDQPRDQQVIGQVGSVSLRVHAQGIVARHDGFDQGAPDDDSMVDENGIRRFDRRNPAWCQDDGQFGRLGHGAGAAG
jgi:hypothetical protein